MKRLLGFVGGYTVVGLAGVEVVPLWAGVVAGVVAIVSTAALAYG